MSVFPCILYQRLQVWLDGRFCAAHAVADMLRSVRLTDLCLVTQTFVLPNPGGGADLLEDASFVLAPGHRENPHYRSGTICAPKVLSADQIKKGRRRKAAALLDVLARSANF